jgi:transposase DDE domain
MQLAMHMVTIEDLMPREHFLRKLEAALDLSFVYEETAPLYSKKYGRPTIDPVVIVKYLLVGFLYGIPSERQIERRVQTDIALRWYLGLDLFDRVPDHSTVSQLRRRKPSFRKVFRRLFEEVVGQCVEKGLVSGRVVGVDSTHVRANASRASEELVEVAEEAGVYWERLDDYEEEGLEELERRTGKRRKKRTKQIKRDNRRTHKRVSRTDPESGHLKRPGKPEGPHYLAHQAVDSDYGIIVGQTVTAGDVNDSVQFLGLIEHIHENVVPIQAAAADAAYDFPLAHRALGELGIGFFVRPQKTAARVSVQFTRDDFCRDENRDVYLCPIGKELCLRRLARSASGLFWEYQADKRDCALCPLREKCLCESDKRGARKVSVSYFASDRQRNLERRSSPEYREALKLRQVWCEGSFSAQKREHNLARVLRRGLEAAEDHCLLSATALNLKRMIKHAG